MIRNKFKALFNPFTKQLAVLYGNCVSNYTFQEEEEWTKISFDGDANNPSYLHVQLDYDGCLQLLFYPRQDNDPSLNENLGTYFNSTQIKSNSIPKNIKLIYDDEEWGKEYLNLVKSRSVVTVEEGL